MTTDQLIKEAHEQLLNAHQLQMPADVLARCHETLARLYRLQDAEQHMNEAGVVQEAV